MLAFHCQRIEGRSGNLVDDTMYRLDGLLDLGRQSGEVRLDIRRLVLK